MKSNSTTGIKNTASYIRWLYTTWDQMVASNMIHCVLFWMIKTIYKLLYQIQTMFVDYLQANHPHIKETNLHFWRLWRTVQKLQEIYGFMVPTAWFFYYFWMSFSATSYWKFRCNGIGRAFKQHVAKRSLQRSLNNQISDYNAMLDLCENEMTSIKFFGICKDSMISVENREIEKWY